MTSAQKVCLVNDSCNNRSWLVISASQTGVDRIIYGSSGTQRDEGSDSTSVCVLDKELSHIQTRLFHGRQRLEKSG